MQINTITEADVLKIAELEKEAFSDPWSEAAIRDCIDSKGLTFYVMKQDEEIVGYVCFTEALDEADVANVCIAKKHRREGLGYKMMTMCLQMECQKGITKYFLEVRKSNESAIRLYDKCGFVVIGERKNFYQFPTEDAVMMMKSI